MRKISVLQVDAFSQVPFAGNPAGVVLEADGLDETVMQSIAAEMNCSETAFVSSGPSGLRFRYFTPAVEVDLCGHATIAALHALGQQGVVGELQVKTNVGVLNMSIGQDGTCWMEQAEPQFRPVDSDQLVTVAGLLGLSREQIQSDIPLGLAYTGLWDLMVPVKDLHTLRTIRPDFDGLEKLNRQQGAASTHVYTFQTERQGSTLHARDFSPAVGVPEDPHTGTASGALGAWLVHQGVLKPGEHVFEQGWSVGRPGFIHVSLSENREVRVGGYAATVLRGEIFLGER